MMRPDTRIAVSLQFLFNRQSIRLDLAQKLFGLVNLL